MDKDELKDYFDIDIPDTGDNKEKILSACKNHKKSFLKRNKFKFFFASLFIIVVLPLLFLGFFISNRINQNKRITSNKNQSVETNDTYKSGEPIVQEPTDPTITEITNIPTVPDSEPVPTPILYSTTIIDNTEYDLGVTLDIEFIMFSDFDSGNIEKYPEYFSDGDLYIKLDASPYYDIISESVQVYHDFSYEKNVNRINLRDNPENIVKFNFQIRFKEGMNTGDLYKFIVFRAKFSYDIEGAINNIPNITNYGEFYPEEEYFLVLPKIAFIINNNTVRLYKHHYTIGKIIDSNTIYPDEYINALFFQRMNKKYDKGLVNVDEYLSSVRAFMTNEMVYINLEQDNIYYISRNIYAIFDKNVIDEETMNNYNDGNYYDVALKLLLILKDKNIIDDEKYNLELDYLENNQTTNYFFYPEWWRMTDDIQVLCEDKIYGLPVMYVVNKDK